MKDPLLDSLDNLSQLCEDCYSSDNHSSGNWWVRLVGDHLFGALKTLDYLTVIAVAEAINAHAERKRKEFKEAP